MTDLSALGQVPILGTTRDPITARLKVSAATREQIQIGRGEFFVGRTLRTNIGVVPTTVYYSQFTAGANYVVIEEVFQTLDFSSVTDGRFQHLMEGFVDLSNINDWTYTPASTLPAGRNLNAALINNLPDSVVDLGGTGTVNSGQADYTLFDTTFYIDTGGNRNTLAESGDDFFSKGRQIILSPGQSILIRATSSGDATGTADIKTTFFFSEIAAEDFPTTFGAVAP